MGVRVCISTLDVFLLRTSVCSGSSVMHYVFEWLELVGVQVRSSLIDESLNRSCSANKNFSCFLVATLEAVILPMVNFC